METTFKDPTHIKPDDIIALVMKHAMAGNTNPLRGASDDLVHQIGYEVFGAYEVLRVFEDHASEHDQSHARYLGYDVFKTVAYCYGEAEALQVVNALNEKFKGRSIPIKDLAPFIDDTEILASFSNRYIESVNYRYRGESHVLPHAGYTYPFRDQPRLKNGIQYNENLADYVARRTLKPEQILKSVTAYLSDPGLKPASNFYFVLCQKYRKEHRIRLSEDYLKHICETGDPDIATTIRKKHAAAALNSNRGSLIAKPHQINAADLERKLEVTRSFGEADQKRNQRPHRVHPARVIANKIK